MLSIPAGGTARRGCSKAGLAPEHVRPREVTPQTRTCGISLNPEPEVLRPYSSFDEDWLNLMRDGAPLTVSNSFQLNGSPDEGRCGGAHSCGPRLRKGEVLAYVGVPQNLKDLKAEACAGTRRRGESQLGRNEKSKTSMNRDLTSFDFFARPALLSLLRPGKHLIYKNLE